MTNVAGRAVYITGGSSGMGFAAGKKLAALGAHIAVFDRSAGGDALKQIEAARRAPDQRVAAYTMNVADRDAVLAVMKRAVTKFGAPDIVIHMAGIGGAGELANMPFELFDRIMQVNVYGTRHVVEAVLPSMLARGSGKIVLVGSMGGIVPVFGYTAYGGSKFAVVGMAQCLRYELKPHGLSVACFCPGEVDTPGLAAERQNLHPATAALKKIGGTMPVDAVVQGLIDGIRNDEFLIIPGLKVKLTYWMHRVTPPRLWHMVTDAIVAVALRRTK